MQRSKQAEPSTAGIAPAPPLKAGGVTIKVRRSSTTGGTFNESVGAPGELHSTAEGTWGHTQRMQWGETATTGRAAWLASANAMGRDSNGWYPKPEGSVAGIRAHGCLYGQCWEDHPGKAHLGVR